MIGEACRFYGWTPDQCLKMPAVTFFAMLDAMKTLEAYEKIEACDIAFITICTSEWYKLVRGRYEKVIDDQRFDGVEIEETPNRPGIDGEEAKEFMMSIFAAKKGMA